MGQEQLKKKRCMKILNLLLFPLMTVLLFGSIGCEKDAEYYRGAGGSDNSVPLNSAPFAFAGKSQFVWPPSGIVTLKGSYADYDDNVVEVKWTRVGGPGACIFENRNSASTKVSGLQAGTYRFEFTVTDKMNLSARDTVSVVVGEISTNPNGIIFKDLVWGAPLYKKVEIKNFLTSIPRGILFKIFIQRDNDPNWEEVPDKNSSTLPPNALYNYFIIAHAQDFFDEGSLYISCKGTDVSDTPNVMIVY